MTKVLPVKPLLIMLYGFPGAGKSYFARQLAETLHAAHIQGDRIRTELFENPRYDKEENEVITHLMDYMAEEFLSAGMSVIYDTNAMRTSQRRELREMARKAHAEHVFVWLQIDAESAYARVSKRDRRRSDDKYATPLNRQTFEKQIGGMQNPLATEDYVVVSGKHVFAMQRSAFMKRLRELGLVRPEEAGPNMIKPGLVNLVPKQVGGRVDMSRRNIIIR
ncbi:MAG TPA: ATP-binding protein [Candidatus Saccharimonadales bacterium]|nr:ATP-binding protein [Candidatus Saccharimonadales bacterium]